MSCVTSTSIPLTEKTYAPRPTNYTIDVYVEEDVPVVLQREIGMLKRINQLPSSAIKLSRIDVTGAAGNTWRNVLDKAKIDTRAIGGSGFYIDSWETAYSGGYMIPIMRITTYRY